MKSNAKKKAIPMDQLTAGYEEFIKGKETKDNGKAIFQKAIKKAAKPTKRGSK